MNREDNNFAEKIEERNTKLESYCKSKSYKQLDRIDWIAQVITGVDYI